MKAAADEWNKIGFGVIFDRTFTRANAHFDVVFQEYEPDAKQISGRSFFPNDLDENTLIIFRAGLYQLYEKVKLEMLKGTFLHELGHILGLRHEFALTDEKDKETKAATAIQFHGTQTNEDSVMNYGYKPAALQDTDIAGIKAFYQVANGTKIGTFPVVDFEPKLRKTTK